MTETTLVPATQHVPANPTETALMELQQIADTSCMAAIDKLPTVIRTYRIASGVKQLRDRIKLDGEIMDTLVALQDTKLGFVTDRAPGNKSNLAQYTRHQVREAAIEALLRGAYWVDNEFNIIASGCYLTLNYFRRIVGGLVSGLEIRFGTYEERQVKRGDATITEAVVSARATWSYKGNPMEMVCEKTGDDDYRIPVRVNASMGTDAIFGKAERKLLARINRKITGSTWLEKQTAEDDVIDIEAVEPKPTPKTEPYQKLPLFASDEVMQAIHKQVCEISMITELDLYKSAIDGRGMHPDDLQRINKWIDKRREQIRSGRGQRANGK
jgi:hypothetical protein